MATTPIRYPPDVEKVEPDEGETQAELVKTFRSIIETTNKDYGHAFRGVHAKSHALLEGRLTVNPNLPPELAQGILPAPVTILSSSVSRPRPAIPCPTRSRCRAALP